MRHLAASLVHCAAAQPRFTMSLDTLNLPSAAKPTPLQHTMQRVMLRMVTLEGGELSRRRVPESELVYRTTSEDQRVAKVLDTLINARLVVKGKEADGDSYVEPAHDALV